MLRSTLNNDGVDICGVFGNLDTKHCLFIWFKSVAKTDQKTLLLCDNHADTSAERFRQFGQLTFSVLQL